MLTTAEARATIMQSLESTGNMRSVYTVDQAAKALGYSRSVTYELIAQGKIPSAEIGGRRRVTITMLVDHLLERDQSARRAS